MIESRLDTIYRIKQKVWHGSGRTAGLAGSRRGGVGKLPVLRPKDCRTEDSGAGLICRRQKAAEALTQSRLKGFTAMNKEMRAALEFLNMPGIRFAPQACTGAAVLPRAGYGGIPHLHQPWRRTPSPWPKSPRAVNFPVLCWRSRVPWPTATPCPPSSTMRSDTGVSGLAAGRIGQLLHQTAAGHQVLCITHTPQVAAFADNQLLIQKKRTR